MEKVTFSNDEYSSINDLNSIINNEIYNSNIGKKFKELEINSITDYYDDLYNPYDGL